MPIHLGDRDIKFSSTHVLLGLAIGVSVVVVLYYLEPKSPTYELCIEVAQAAYEKCSSDTASQDHGFIKLPQKNCSLLLDQDLLACD